MGNTYVGTAPTAVRGTTTTINTTGPSNIVSRPAYISGGSAVGVTRGYSTLTGATNVRVGAAPSTTAYTTNYNTGYTGGAIRNTVLPGSQVNVVNRVAAQPIVNYTTGTL